MAKKKKSFIPSTISILGEVYKVEVRKDPIDYEGKHVEGLCMFDEETILIYDSGNLKTMFITFLHECCHVFLEITGMTQYMNKREIEMFCQKNSYFIYQLIKGLNENNSSTRNR